MKRQPEIFNEQRLREAMARDGIDVVILRGNENSKYVSEFFHTGGFLAYRPFTVFFFQDPAFPPALVVPAVDLHLAMDATWIEDVRGYAMAEFFTDLEIHFYADFFEAARAILAERNVCGKVIGTEGEALPAGFKMKLDEMLEGNRIVDYGAAMEIVRMVKTPEEVRRLKQATDITIIAHAAFRDAIRIGASDFDLFRAATHSMIDNGADGIRFINIGCGPQTSYAAHAPFPIGHAIRDGDFVKVDMGASVRGYGGDFVRSYFVNHATERHKEIWRRLNDVQIEVGLSMRPGMTGGEIFDLGYRLIDKYLPDFPREFIGHGIGIGAHEQPRLNQVNRTVLEPDTVYCIEYSYYHDGIRHHTEDTFCMREDNVEFWTKSSPRDLVVAG